MYAGQAYQKVPGTYDVAECSNNNVQNKSNLEDSHVLKLWKQQFVDSLTVSYFMLYMLNAFKTILVYVLFFFSLVQQN
jgi:hypothetical protein